jgi:hypothetical protein
MDSLFPVSVIKKMAAEFESNADHVLNCNEMGNR